MRVFLIETDVIKQPTQIKMDYNGTDDDDDDDNINIIINYDRMENKKIANLSKPTHNVYNIDYSHDVELQQELKNLVLSSINPKTSKTITVQYLNQLILIPINVAISSRLSALFWSPSLMFEERKLPFVDEFNRIIGGAKMHLTECGYKYPDGTNISETVAIFGATYKKNMINVGNDSVNHSLKHDDAENFKSCHTGIYRYYDFALLIVKNGQIIDYAIHAYASNINEAIYHYRPTKIFYNAVANDALDVFLRYPYQPFYASTFEKLQPCRVSILRDYFNILVFCERRSAFCALCNCLKYLRSLLLPFQSNVQPVQETPKTNRFRKIPTLLNGRRYSHSKYWQPTHNSKQRHLKIAAKKPTFNLKINKSNVYYKNSGKNK